MNNSLLINNEWHKGNGESFESTNPVKNNVIWQGNECLADDVEKAVFAARHALMDWANSSIEQRFEIVQQYKQILEKNKEKISALIAEETGKPLWESKTEVAAMIAKVDISKVAYDERTGVKEELKADSLFATRHKPHGVLAVYGPYNFPGHLPNGHIIPALIAGNTIVFKPSESTPAVGEFMVQCWLDAGLPPGVLNLVQGGRTTGEALASEAQIDGILFTGSFATGKILHKALAGNTGKLLALEMGGNNPLIVTEVNDIDAAVYNIIQSAFITAGQRCTCARRLILKTDEADAIINRLIEVTKNIQVGSFNADPQPFMGAVINQFAAQHVLQSQASLVSQGAQMLLESTQLRENTALLSPGIIDVTGIETADHEIFGPLLQIIRVNDFAQAIAEANNTRYGLAAGLLSDNKSLYQQFYQQARAGIINWNRPTTGAAGSAPFGGIGQSGNLRPSAYYAADYCAYPVASVECEQLYVPDNMPPGLSLA